MERPADPLRDRMIFVVGARRSGTNWIQRVVGAHPDVAAVPSETYLFSRGIKQLRERFHHGVLGSPTTGVVHMDREALIGSLRDFCDRVFLPFLEAVPGAKRLVERTPEHATCVDLIGEIYPDAHVVHIIRDGRDVARSLLSQDWGTAPRSIEAAAEEWRSCVDAAEEAGRTLRLFRAVRYEELVADPLGQVTRLYGWLGLEAGSSTVESALLEAEVASNVDPTAPSVRVGKWRDSFSDDDIRTFLRVAGATLDRLGYLDRSAPGDAADRSSAGAPPGTAAGGARPSRSLRSLIRRRSAEPAAPSGGGRARRVATLLAETERIVARVVACFTTGKQEDLATLLPSSAWVRVVSGTDDWSGRGVGAHERLAETVAADEALRERQVAGDVHVGIPTSSAVMRFAGSNGTGHIRVLAVSVQDGAVTRLTYYQFASRA